MTRYIKLKTNQKRKLRRKAAHRTGLLRRMTAYNRIMNRTLRVFHNVPNYQRWRIAQLALEKQLKIGVFEFLNTTTILKGFGRADISGLEQRMAATLALLDS